MGGENGDEQQKPWGCFWEFWSYYKIRLVSAPTKHSKKYFKWVKFYSLFISLELQKSVFFF